MITTATPSNSSPHRKHWVARIIAKVLLRVINRTLIRHVLTDRLRLRVIHRSVGHVGVLVALQVDLLRLGWCLLRHRGLTNIVVRGGWWWWLLVRGRYLLVDGRSLTCSHSWLLLLRHVGVVARWKLDHLFIFLLHRLLRHLLGEMLIVSIHVDILHVIDHRAIVLFNVHLTRHTVVGYGHTRMLRESHGPVNPG